MTLDKWKLHYEEITTGEYVFSPRPYYLRLRKLFSKLPVVRLRKK